MELDHLEKWESGEFVWRQLVWETILVDIVAERKKPLEGQADPVKMVQVECKV